MLRYIVRRVLWGIALLGIVSAVVFVLFYVLPTADPAKLRAGRTANPELIAQIRAQLHLDEPIYVQFWNYMNGVFLHLDFGQSYLSQAPVLDIIFDRLPATALLVVGSVILWLVIGLTVGIISAVKRRSVVDRVTMVTTLGFISAPVFWLGLVMLYLFAKDIGQIPIFPGVASYQEADGLLEQAYALILPWFVLAAVSAAIYARLLCGSPLETMSEDYIRTACAKGLRERRVVLRRGVRSAINPLVTAAGIDIGILLGGAILTESVFDIPGIGLLAYTSIDQG